MGLPHEHERTGGRRLSLPGERRVAPDHRETGALQHPAKLVGAVHAQLVAPGRAVPAAHLQALRLAHHPACAVKAPVDPQRAPARERPLLALAAHRDLAKQFGTTDLSGFGCDGLDAAVAAAGALLAYCGHTQQSAIPHVTGLRVERESELVMMDAPTRRNLEITETLAGAESPTLFSLLDRCSTSMGSRRLRHWLHHPLRDTKELAARHAVIAALVHSTSRLRHPRLARLFSGWSDVERITARIALRTARPRDLSKPVVTAAKEADPAQRIAVYERSRPDVEAHFAGRRDF